MYIEFRERLVSGCWGKDQVYYKYKTDYWRKGGGFPTPTGKFEIESEWLRGHGYDALPVYVEPVEGPLAAPVMMAVLAVIPFAYPWMPVLAASSSPAPYSH